MNLKPDLGRLSNQLGGRIREPAIRLWQSKGGGFYGLGYLVAFAVLQVRLFVDDVTESDGVSDFVTNALFEQLFRFATGAFINGFRAFLWPLELIGAWQLWGVAAIVGGYILFEQGLRPLVEVQFPELRTTREARQEKKRAKREQRALKKYKGK